MAAERPLADYFGGKGAEVMAGMLKAAGGSHSQAEREFFATVNADRKGTGPQRAQEPRFAPGTLPAHVPPAQRTPRFGKPRG